MQGHGIQKDNSSIEMYDSDKGESRYFISSKKIIGSRSENSHLLNIFKIADFDLIIDKSKLRLFRNSFSSKQYDFLSSREDIQKFETL